MSKNFKPSLWTMISPGRWTRNMITATVRCNIPPALVALIAYLKTIAPSVYGFDSAELTTGAYTLGIVHPTGYPLYLLLAKVFTFLPIHNVAYRVNLMSAIFGALTVWLVAYLAYRITGVRWTSWIGACSLAFAHSFWNMSLVAEVYTLHTFLLAVNLLLLERWFSTRNDRWLMGLAFAYGLSLTNHVSSALFAPAFILPVLRNKSPRRILRLAPKMGLLFSLGLCVYLYLPLRYNANPHLNYVMSYYGIKLNTPEGLWWMISGQAYRFFAFGYGLTGHLSEVVAVGVQIWRNITGVGVLMAILGITTLLRRRHPLAFSTMMIFILTIIFFTGYAVVDKETMFLPVYVVCSLWIAQGAKLSYDLAKRLGKTLHSNARAHGALVQGALVGYLFIMCGFNWRVVDMSGAYGFEVFARQVLRSVAPNAMVLGPWSSSVVLEYFQEVEGLRPDVTIFNRSRYEVAEYYKLWVAQTPHQQAVEEILTSERTLVDLASKERTIYDLEYNPGLATTFEYQPVGYVFQLMPKDQEIP